MPGITGMGTTFNLPNFVGELFELTPSDTPFLSAIGGLTGGVPTTATEFEWQTRDLRDPAQNTALEGADAPAADARVRQNVTNVVEIHQDAVSVSYTKMAAVGQRSGSNIDGQNPVRSELDWQVEGALKEIGRDIEYSFLNGVYQKPSDNATPRKTRGLLAAIETNAVAAAGAALTRTLVLDIMQAAWDSGGLKESDTATLIVNSYQKRMLSEIFVNEKFQGADRTVGGVNVQTIITDFGTVNIMLNRYIPADTLVVCSLEMCKPRILEVPGKGFLFYESLAKTGSSEKGQIYGEIGLEYGNEAAHGKITGLATGASAG